jgi:hypothetical protein
VGIWEQETNPFDTTTVVYNIAVKNGRFLVSGVDEEDDTALRVSNVRWDGKQLCFTTIFPPTRHKAGHVFCLLGKKQAKHQVSYSDEEGNYVGDEVWKRRNSPRKRDLKASASSATKRVLAKS